nr:RNA-directed DNA polymerase, eukaryota, reverse transcriptase zinc-binding domain protein [Tanacetum cinerariifolium]
MGVKCPQKSEIGTWNIHISNDYDDGDISLNGNVDLIETLDDFIQHVVKEKEVEKAPHKNPKADDSKPFDFEKNQVKFNPTVTHKDIVADEVVSDNSKPPSFENFIEENKACSQSSSTSRAGKCSTSFSKYSRKDLKGFYFIDEMNQMIEVGGALGYEVKRCNKSLRRLISGIAHRLSIANRDFLESMVSIDENKAVVWDCGLSIKCRNLIKAGLASARTCTLINRSPTSEFPLKRVLTQGDPLSPFLFIIVMKGLHMILNDGLAANMFHDVKVGSPGMHLSCLFYTYDVIILSVWNLNAMENIIQILNIFYIASRLKINIHKSNVYGVKVSSNEVLETVVKSLKSLRASFFWGSSEDILAFLDKGGIGIGSLKSFNMSLLLKWRWHLFHNSNALWVYVVKAIHGDEASINIRGCHTNEVWASIVKSIFHLHSSGIVSLNFIFLRLVMDLPFTFGKIPG